MEFADLGFRSMSIEPVVAAPEEEYAIREEDLRRSWKSTTVLPKSI